MDAFIGYTIAGLATGAIYAIAASGLVVTYTTSGVFNFAHGAIGMIMAFLYWQLRVHQHWPAPVALLVVLFVAAPLLGGVIDAGLIRRININDTGTTLVVTLAMTVGLMGFTYLIWPATVTRTLTVFFGQSRYVTIASNRVSYHQIVTLILAMLVAGFLRLLFYRTRTGIAMRAVVDDRDLAALNGAAPARISLLSWAIGASLGALAGILQATSTNSVNVLDLTFLVVNGFAAAMLGRLKSLPLTFLGALILGLLNAYVTGYVPLHGTLSLLVPALPTLFLFAVLLTFPAVRLRAGQMVATRSPRVTSARESLVSSVLFITAVVVVVNLLHGTSLHSAAQAMSVGIFGLSLVLLTGYGGQVSLCQYSFIGFGAYVFAHVAPSGNPLGLVVVAVAGAVLGAIIALPALRLTGLYLALSTLAFARLAEYMFFLQPKIMGSDGIKIHRLSFPFFSVSGDRANVVMLAVAFALLAMLVLAIRRGPFGRLLGAMRDSPAACATLGLNLTVTKMAVFALATSMATVGGALFGASQHFVTEINFQYIQSLFLLLVVAIWGIRSPTGALLGGISLATISQLIPHLPPRFQVLPYLFTGLGAIGLVRYPGGVISQFAAAKETMQARFAAGGTPRPSAGAPGPPGGAPRPSAYSAEEVRPVAVAAD